MRKTNSIAQVISASALILACTSVSAVTNFTWDYVASGTGANGSTGTPYSWSPTAEGLITGSTTLHIVNATAWANTGGPNPSPTYSGLATNTFEKQTLEDSGSGMLRVRTTNDGGLFNAAGLDGDFGYPNHAMDNSGPIEMILFEFDKAVTLNSLKIGWPSGGTNCTTSTCDTDVSVLAVKDQVADPKTTLLATDSGVGTGLNDLTKFSAATSFHANKDGTSTSFNPGSISSKYWLVGAYNSFLGGSLSAGDDFVKLASLGGFTPSSGGGGGVPEPSSLALVGLGLIGGLRRWKAKKA